MPMDEKRVIEHLNSLCTVADSNANPDVINSLPGIAKHYYANVFKLHAMTPEGWVRDFPGAAQAIMNSLLEADDKEQLRQRLAALEALIGGMSTTPVAAERSERKTMFCNGCYTQYEFGDGMQRCPICGSQNIRELNPNTKMAQSTATEPGCDADVEWQEHKG